jgi:hypothetical protein
LVRARAVLDATRDPAGKQIRTVVQAVAWIDKTQPKLTDAWLTWVGVQARKKKKAEPLPLKGAAPPLPLQLTRKGAAGLAGLANIPAPPSGPSNGRGPTAVQAP